MRRQTKRLLSETAIDQACRYLARYLGPGMDAADTLDAAFDGFAPADFADAIKSTPAGDA